MSFSNKEKSIIEKALVYWQSNKFIETDQAQKLKENLPTKGFDWKSLAFYTSVFALVSLVIAVISIFADEALLKLIDSFIQSSFLTKTIFGIMITVLFYFLDHRFAKKNTQKNRYSAEVYALLAAISLAITTGLLSFLIGYEEKPGILIAGLSGIYFVIGKMEIKYIYWFFGMAALLFAFGSLTITYETANDNFLGMNYPLRFTTLGAILVGVSLLIKKHIQPFYKVTYNTSIMIFFSALWILSITGNYDNYNDWLAIRQYELWAYSLLLFIISAIAIVIGLKNEDHWLKNTGIIFIFINLYTRYFEYFWDSIHKALFFLIMALSFWLIGKWAEKLWAKKSE